MKHVKLIARAHEISSVPREAQSSSLEVKVDFLVDLTDRIITIIMQAASSL
jgi:hypothetical protein